MGQNRESIPEPSERLKGLGKRECLAKIRWKEVLRMHPERVADDQEPCRRRPNSRLAGFQERKRQGPSDAFQDASSVHLHAETRFAFAGKRTRGRQSGAEGTLMHDSRSDVAPMRGHRGVRQRTALSKQTATELYDGLEQGDVTHGSGDSRTTLEGAESIAAGLPSNERGGAGRACITVGRRSELFWRANSAAAGDVQRRTVAFRSLSPGRPVASQQHGCEPPGGVKRPQFLHWIPGMPGRPQTNWNFMQAGWEFPTSLLSTVTGRMRCVGSAGRTVGTSAQQGPSFRGSAE